MTTYRTRIIPVDETVERLSKLTETPVIDRPRIEKYFGRFIESLKVYKDGVPPIQWLEGPHDLKNILLNQGIYFQDTRVFYERLAQWMNTIERAQSMRWGQDIHLPLIITTVDRNLAPPIVTSRSVRMSVYLDHNYLRAYEAGLGFWIVCKQACILFPRPVLRFFDEAPTRRVLHSTIAAAVEYPNHPQSNQYYYRGARVPEFVITHPESITLAHIRAARSIQVRRAMIDRYGLLRYAQERGYKPVDTDEENGCILWVKGGKHHWETGTSMRHCILEMINATPLPDGTRQHFARRVNHRCQTAREAVAWTFRKNADEYHPAKQT